MHRCLTIFGCLLFATIECYAGIIRHDDVDNNPSNNDSDGNPNNGLDDALYRSLANQSQFDSAIFLDCPSGSCSGTLIAPDWILTAGHCVVSRWDAPGPGDPPLPQGVNVGDLIDDRPGRFTMVDKFGRRINSIRTVVNPQWLISIRSHVFNDPGQEEVASGNGSDFALIQLASPAIVPAAMRNSNPVTAGMHGDTVVTLVGYGRHGTGSTGAIAGSGGTRRAGENIFDEFDGLGGTNNLMLFDLDNQGTLGTLGSVTPRTLEYIGASGDSGGPWYVTNSGLTRLIGVHSFGRNNRTSNPSSHYGDVSGAGRVDLVNNWINETMGGVNWNSRGGFASFHDASRWGDGRVPTSQDVRFSLPDIAGAPVQIAVNSAASVRNIQVEFGEHQFELGTLTTPTTLTAAGGVNVDSNGKMVIRIGNLVVSDELTVGGNDNGTFEMRAGSRVDVASLMNVGSAAGSEGRYIATGGTATFGGSILIGRSGKGRMEVSNNASISGNALALGRDNGGFGELIQDGGLVDVTTDAYLTFVSANATGNYYLRGGQFRVGNDLAVGSVGKGTFEQSGGTVNGGSILQVGVAANSEGNYFATGGTATFGGSILIGRSGKGRMKVSNNASISGNALALGRDNGGFGELIQDGGLVDITTDAYLTFDSANATGNYYLRGGELFVGGAINFGPGNGDFDFTGGTLHVGTYNGDLDNQGTGTLAPGNSAGLTTITGDYSQASTAALEIEIGGTIAATHFDLVNVGGMAELAGILDVSLLGAFMPTIGQQFTVLTATEGVVNNGLMLGGAASGLFDLLVGSSSVVLQAVSPILPGDYNNNGVVDAADYTVWRDNVGSTDPLLNDSIGGTIGQVHYNQWIANFGRTAGNGSIENAAVPEPSSLLLAAIFGCIGLAVGALNRSRQYPANHFRLHHAG